MLIAKKQDLGKQSYSFTVTIVSDEIRSRYSIAFDELAKSLTVDGFRKGNVPKKVAEKHLKKEDVYHKVADVLVQDTYRDLIKEQNLKPIVSPHVELVKADENSDWVIRFTIAERPVVNLGDLKSLVAEFRKGAKKANIWTPGQMVNKPDEVRLNEQEADWINKLISHLAEKISIDIADIVIDDAVNRRLSQLVDDVQKIGLTMDKYLASKGETVESMKNKHRQEIKNNLKTDLILDEVANQEKITVEQSDFDAFFQKIKDEKIRSEATKNAYYYASIIRMQKTLDFLKSL